MPFPIFLLYLIFYTFFSIARADSPTKNSAIQDHSLKHNTIIIYSGHNTIPSHVRVREGWQNRLAESQPENEKIDVFEEYLDDIRLKITQDFDVPFINLWHKKYEHIKLDMVVTVGPAADSLMNRHPELFANIPYYSMNVAGINKNNQQFGNEIYKIINVVPTVLPDTKQLILVMESRNNHTRYNENLFKDIEMVKHLLPEKMSVEIYNNFSFDELYERAGHLPENTAILYFPTSIDRLGQRKIPFEVLQKLTKTSTVPIFVHDDTYLSLNVVGGYIRNLKEEGDIIGRLILGLDIPRTDDAYDQKVRGYFFNDLELKRWHISEKNLPPNSTITNRKESFLYTYRWYVGAAILLLLAALAELGLIVKLVKTLRQRRKMERELANERNLLEIRVAERTSELEESRILFQDAASVAKLGVFNYDLMTNELTWDDSMFAIYSIEQPNVKSIYQAWRKITLSEDVTTLKNALQLAIAENTAFDTRFRIFHSDGKIRTIHALGQIYRDAHGKPLRVVGINQDITEREEAEAIIRNLAYYDPLTQLANRRLLAEQLKQAISHSRRETKKFAVMMMDLDKFKAVNDTLGHASGDELLQQVAHRIKTNLREYDVVARLGGDEFVVVLKDIHCPKDAACVAKTLITVLTEPFALTQSDNVQIGTSIGISFFPQHGEDADELIDKADAALYQAKHNGRGCFSFYLETDEEIKPFGFNTVFCAGCIESSSG